MLSQEPFCLVSAVLDWNICLSLLPSRVCVSFKSSWWVTFLKSSQIFVIALANLILGFSCSLRKLGYKIIEITYVGCIIWLVYHRFTKLHCCHHNLILGYSFFFFLLKKPCANYRCSGIDVKWPPTLVLKVSPRAGGTMRRQQKLWEPRPSWRKYITRRFLFLLLLFCILGKVSLLTQGGLKLYSLSWLQSNCRLPASSSWMLIRGMSHHACLGKRKKSALSKTLASISLLRPRLPSPS